MFLLVDDRNAIHRLELELSIVPRLVVHATATQERDEKTKQQRQPLFLKMLVLILVVFNIF